MDFFSAQKQLKERLAHLPEMTSQLEKAQELEAKVQEVSKQGEKEKGIIQKKYEVGIPEKKNHVFL